MICLEFAGVAQLVEHRFCKPKVRGSSPLASSARLLRTCESRPLTGEGGTLRSLSRAVPRSALSSEVLGASRLRRPAVNNGGDKFGATVGTKCESGEREVSKESRGLQSERAIDNIEHRRRPNGRRRSADGFWGQGARLSRATRGSFAKDPQWQGWNEADLSEGARKIRPSLCEGAAIFEADLRRVETVGCPSGQREQAVNLPASAYEGSNPSPTTTARKGGNRASGSFAGVAQLVERQPSKLNVVGSNPISRSIPPSPTWRRRDVVAHIAQ